MAQQAETFKGTPDDLAARINALIGAGKTIVQVVPSKANGQYIIVYS